MHTPFLLRQRNLNKAGMRGYLFLINSSLANIKQRRAFGLTHFLSGGLGAALMAGADFYAKYKGWKE